MGLSAAGICKDGWLNRRLLACWRWSAHFKAHFDQTQPENIAGLKRALHHLLVVDESTIR
jgi:hypothetical protein